MNQPKPNKADLLAASGERQQFEIVVGGAAIEQLKSEIVNIPGAILTAKPNGANIHVLEESDVETVLQANKKSGGKLISVQPVRQSLEEFFVRETGGASES